MPFEDAIQADVEFRANTGQFRADMGAIRGEYARTTGAMSTESLKAAVAQEKLDRAIARHGAESLQAKTATLAYRNELDSLAAAGRRSSAALAEEERELGRLGRGALAGSGLVRGLGRSLAFASTGFLGGAGLVYALRSSVTAASAYEQTLHEIIGLTGTSAAETERWSRQLLTLGPQVAKTPQELAQALYFVASSGIHGARALDVVRVSAKAATAGLGETQVVADALTSALNAYGQANLTAAQAGDVLVATVREGKGEASAIAPVLGNILPVAAQLGVRFNEVGAALAGMTRVGFDPATAGTNLSAFFNQLLKDSPGTEKALNKVGLSAAGLRSELKEKGLIATLDTLKQAFHGNVAEMAHAFPNIRALRGVLSLTGKDAAEVTGIFARMRDNTGDLAKAFGAASDTSAAKFAKMRAAVQATEITVGGALLPSVLKVTDAVTKWSSKTENQRRLQRDATEVVRDGTAAVHVLGDGLHDLGVILGPLDRALGGSEHTVRLLVAALAYRKIAPFVRGIGAELVPALRRVGPAATVAGARVDESFVTIGGTATSAELKVAALQREIDALHGKTVVVNVDEVVTASGGSVRGSGTRVGGREIVVPAPSRSARVGQRAARSFGALASFALDNLGPIAAVQFFSEGSKGPLHRVLRADFNAGRSAGRAATDIAARLFGARRQQKPASIPGAPQSLGDLNALFAVPEFGFQPGFPAGTVNVVDRRTGTVIARFDPSKDRGLAALFDQQAQQRARSKNQPSAARAYRTKLRERRDGDRKPKPAPTRDTGGHGGGPKPLKTFVLPYRLQLEQAKAAATIGTADDLKAARDIRAYTLKLIASHRLVGQALLDAENEIGSQNATITGLDKHRVAGAKTHDAQLRKARAAEVKRLTSVPVGLRIEEASARAHAAGEQRLLAIYKQELKALDEQLAVIRKQHLGKEAIAKNLQAQAAVEQKIQTARKHKPTDTAALEREFLSTRADFFSSFGSDVFTEKTGPGGKVVRTPGSQRPTVVVHQHFNAPTTDRHREARLASLAVRAAMDG